MERLQRHHLCYTRREWLQYNISRQVRNHPTFSLFLAAPVHRYLHMTLLPPELPDFETLIEMRDMAKYGLDTVMDNLGDERMLQHLDTQLAFASIPVGMATKLIKQRRDELQALKQQ